MKNIKKVSCAQCYVCLNNDVKELKYGYAR